MSVNLAIAALAEKLQLINPWPQEPPREGCIFADPKESVSVSDFPSIIIAETPGRDHTWTIEALGLGRHDYAVSIYVLLGIRQTSLSELHSRAMPWSEAIMRILCQNIQLGGVVNQIGFGGDPRLFTYKIGPIPWGEGPDGAPLVYWGLTLLLPITEKPVMEMSP